MTSFEKEHKKAMNRKNRKLLYSKFKIFFSTKNDEWEFYFFLLPLLPFAMLSSLICHWRYNIYHWRYNRLQWNEHKATKILDKTLPKVVSYDEDIDAYCYCLDWASWGLVKQCPFYYRNWVSKFSCELHSYVANGYKSKEYRKIVQKDTYETWVIFSKPNE